MLDDVEIRNSEWLVINIRGFIDELVARNFAIRLKRSTELASVTTRFGIDGGLDLATSQVGEMVAASVRKASGVILRGNVHGVDVMPDDENVKIFSIGKRDL